MGCFISEKQKYVAFCLLWYTRYNNDTAYRLNFNHVFCFTSKVIKNQVLNNSKLLVQAQKIQKNAFYLQNCIYHVQTKNMQSKMFFHANLCDFFNTVSQKILNVSFVQKKEQVCVYLPKVQLKSNAFSAEVLSTYTKYKLYLKRSKSNRQIFVYTQTYSKQKLRINYISVVKRKSNS